METILVYLSILLRYKWLVFSITVLAAIGVVVYAVISLRLPPEESPMPNYYEAYATLLVSEDGGGGGTQAVLSALGVDVGAGGGANYGTMAQEVMGSRSFLDTLVAELNIVERYEIEEQVRTNSRKIAEGLFDYSYNASTGIMTVSAQHIYPEFARDVANTVVRNLQEWFRSRGGLTRQEEIRSLERKLAEIEEEIARLESEIQSFQQEHGVLNPQEIADTQAAMLSDLQSQLVDLEMQIRDQETFSRIENDPAVARLRARRQNVIDLINEIEEGYTAGAGTMPARGMLPQLALDFRRFQTDLEIQQRIYQAVSEQYEIAKLTAETGSAFTVLELAEVPEEKAGPSRGDLAIRVTVGAFAGSVALAFFIHFARGVFSDPKNRRLLAGEPEDERPVTER